MGIMQIGLKSSFILNTVSLNKLKEISSYYESKLKSVKLNPLSKGLL